MPTSVILNGKRLYTLGVRADLNLDAANGASAGVGGVALVGDFPLFESGVVHRFYNTSTLQNQCPRDAGLALLGSFLWNPSSEDAIGGVDSVFIVSASTNTQASADIDDAASNQALVISSKAWGPAGNRTLYTCARDGTEYTWAFARDGFGEEFVLNIPNMGTVQYTDTVLETALLTWAEDEVTYGWSRVVGPKVAAAATPFTEATDWDHCPFQGTVQVVLDEGEESPHTANVTVTLTGLDEAGIAQVEILTFPALTTDLTTVGEWSDITNVVLDTTDDAWEGNATLTCASGLVLPTAGRTISGILGELGQLGGVTHAVLDPRASAIVAEDADYTVGAVDAKTTAQTITAVNSETVLAFNASILVEAERGTSGTVIDLSSDLSAALTGGISTSPVGTTNWQTALDALVDQDVQHVVPMTTTAAVHALLAAHCNDSALQGYERNAWAGVAGSGTLASFISQVAALNSQYVTLVGDRVQLDHPNGTRPIKGPEYLALIGAAMQAGSPIGTPLSHKRPRIRAAYQTWRPNLDADEAIRGGCTILRDRGGLSFNRVLTTHVSDDNVFKSEQSTFESLQACVRHVRAFLGDEVRAKTTGYATLLLARVSEALDNAVDNKIIASWRNLSLVEDGDVSYPQAQVVPIFANNFTVLRLTAQTE